ncbi:Conserved_hypothetical protein [Hexamita inflata]|uniref:BPI-like protein n=1 Tax=Hexamita inflata TaxID=28002 RepID=A0ABP1GJ93_9EUKA
MLLLFINVYTECIPSIFTNDVTSDTSNLKITITKSGIRQFINNCVQNIVEMISRIQFPDMEGVLGSFTVQVKDVVFTDIEVNDFDFILDKHSTVKVNDITAKAEFEIVVIQNQFPYTNFQTRAVAIVQNASVTTITTFQESKTCQGHLEFKTQNTNVNCDKFSFQSDMYIIDSMAQQFGVQFFKQFLTEPLIKAFEDRVNLYLQSYKGEIQFGNDVADQRLYKLNIQPQFINVQMNGLSSYYQQKYSHMKKLQENYSNDEINYVVGKSIFQQVFENVFGEDCDINIVNMGIFANILNESILFKVVPQFDFIESEIKEQRKIIKLFLISGVKELDDKLNENSYYIFDAIFVKNFKIVYREEAVVLFSQFS